MKIALVGYGKMGHAIEQAALKRGHAVVLRITTANIQDLDAAHLHDVDVAIEFTRPDAAKENVLRCLAEGVNVVCGTTGWNDGIPAAQAKAQETSTAFLQASNFSIGVNVFFEINKLLSSLMKGRPQYDITIEETHHTQKKDAPSGTAITLAEQIIENRDDKTHWVLNDFNEHEGIPILAYRVEDVPGTHRVAYSSPIDDITITHTAHNREGFALGAVLAAEFIQGRQGIYTMKDVLGISR